MTFGTFMNVMRAKNSFLKNISNKQVTILIFKVIYVI